MLKQKNIFKAGLLLLILSLQISSKSTILAALHVLASLVHNALGGIINALIDCGTGTVVALYDMGCFAGACVALRLMRMIGVPWLIKYFRHRDGVPEVDDCQWLGG